MPRRIVFVYLRQLLWWLGLLLLLPSVLMYVNEHWIIKMLSNAPSVESISPFVDGNDFYTHRAFFVLFILMKQQELADKIGINMQSLSKIERGLNYPAYETLEKIMEVLDVTPNELLSGEWKYINQSEKEICQFLRAEERLNAELKHGHYDNFFDSEEEWLEYELEKLREYITDYINGKSIEASDLYPIKEFIQHLKFQKLLDRYDDLYSMDMFGESIEGHKYRTPYQVVKMINPNSKEDMELLREVLRNNHFDDEDE